MIVRPLEPHEVERVDAVLPLSRLDQEGDRVYLVAWDGNDPVGHAHLALTDPPEIGDVYVLPERRRQGIASELTRAAEREAAARGHDRVILSVSANAPGPQALYEGLGYVDAGLPPKRVQGTIMLRGEPFEVDDTLLYKVKTLGSAG